MSKKKKIVGAQAIIWAAIEATRAALQAVAVSGAEAGIRQRSIARSMGPEVGEPSLRSYHLTAMPETNIRN